MKKNSAFPLPGAPTIAGVQPTSRRVSAGDLLFRRGDKTIGIFHIGAGRLRMQRVTADGATVTLHVARAGEMLAEASLFVDRYQCDVVAEVDSTVWLYPKDELIRRLRDDPDCLWNFAAGMARGLHALRQRYELKQIRSAPERVLQLLRLSCDASGVYRTAGTLKDLAAELGLTREALYRALAFLQRDGRIIRTTDEIRIVTK